MSFANIPLEIVEHSIFPFVPLIDVWNLDPKSKMFKKRLRRECFNISCWMDIVERDHAEFLSLVVDITGCNLGVILMKIAFAEDKANLVEYIVNENFYNPSPDILECFMIMNINKILSSPDKHFILFIRCLTLHNIRNAIPEHLAEDFLKRALSLDITIGSVCIVLSESLRMKYSKALYDLCPYSVDWFGDQDFESLVSFKMKVRQIENKRYNPDVWIEDNKDILQWITVDPDIIFPKLLSLNPKGMLILIGSKATPDLLWLGKYLSMKVENISVLAYLLANTADWVDILCLESASNVDNLYDDLSEIGYVYGENWIQDYDLPLWFAKLFW